MSNEYIIRLDCAKCYKLTHDHCRTKRTVHEKHDVVIR